MSVVASVPLMSTEELLALPDDGKERWLIRGELREKPMTVRNRWHSRVLSCLDHLVRLWLDQQPEPRGAVLVGEAGCRLRKTPDSTVGIDLVYISAKLAAPEPANTTLIDGVPILAAAVLSPNDTEEEVNEKVDEYLRAGVKLVWLVDPHYQTVIVYRSDAPPQLFNVQQDLTAEPHLPGLRIPVARIFRG
jgi:Uma2 family endonuclease